ncbi:MAG: pirin family protein [Tannerellaceae bacterium]|nr:pirin family protein [Tannerellaceae bacterium]
MKIAVDKAHSRGYRQHGWLKTYHTFSFADYYNPKKMQFGKLRVLNDDTVAPSKGFDLHPHKNMEVVSIPLKGELRHGDSISNSEVIGPGQIQVMSAGTGIYHSEYNASDTYPVEFLQIWVLPQTENARPQYKSYNIQPLLQPNKLALIISPDGDTPARIDQDAWFSLGTIEAGYVEKYTFYGDNTGVYIFIIEGEVEISNTVLSRRDGAGITETCTLLIEVLKDAKILLMEVAME